MDSINGMHIKLFSEIDYMNYFVLIILSEYKIGKTRDDLILRMPKEAASYSRKYYNNNVRDNPINIIDKIAQEVIQNQNRRKIYLGKIKKQISC